MPLDELCRSWRGPDRRMPARDVREFLFQFCPESRRLKGAPGGEVGDRERRVRRRRGRGRRRSCVSIVLHLVRGRVVPDEPGTQRQERVERLERRLEPRAVSELRGGKVDERVGTDGVGDGIRGIEVGILRGDFGDEAGDRGEPFELAAVFFCFCFFMLKRGDDDGVVEEG